MNSSKHGGNVVSPLTKTVNVGGSGSGGRRHDSKRRAYSVHAERKSMSTRIIIEDSK